MVTSGSLRITNLKIGTISKEDVILLLSVKFGVKVPSWLDTCEEKICPTLLGGHCVKYIPIDCEELSFSDAKNVIKC